MQQTTTAQEPVGIFKALQCVRSHKRRRLSPSVLPLLAPQADGFSNLRMLAVDREGPAQVVHRGFTKETAMTLRSAFQQ